MLKNIKHIVRLVIPWSCGLFGHDWHIYQFSPSCIECKEMCNVCAKNRRRYTTEADKEYANKLLKGKSNDC